MTMQDEAQAGKYEIAEWWGDLYVIGGGVFILVESLTAGWDIIADLESGRPVETAATSPA